MPGTCLQTEGCKRCMKSSPPLPSGDVRELFVPVKQCCQLEDQMSQETTQSIYFALSAGIFSPLVHQDRLRLMALTSGRHSHISS
mmetsp:Transcript_9110/g.23162  ORF Transcript_9110/g.23162 Transcript_9110/m.23162 type:complete len:85 (+) Transcript_9110:636-890(+)